MVYILSEFLIIDFPITLDVMTIKSYIQLSHANVPFLYILKIFSGIVEIEHQHKFSETQVFSFKTSWFSLFSTK